MSPNFGTSKIINFTFATNGKSMVLGVPILKHTTVYRQALSEYFQEPAITIE